MSLDDLVRVNISTATATPTKPGFGTILIAAMKVPVTFTSRVRRFGSLTELTDAGFSVGDPTYLCAQKMLAQNPATPAFLVGKRLHKVTQTVHLTCTSAVAGDGYEITVAGHDITYSVPGTGSPTTSTVATAFAALIDALTEVTATATGAVITVTAPAGELVNYKGWTDNLTFTDVTTDAGGANGLADDLAAITASTNQDWYGLSLDSNSSAEVQIASLFVETAKKIMVCANSDAANADPNATTDVMSALKAASYARSGVLHSKKELLSYSGPAWMAKQFAGAIPGSDTWSFKTLAGVTVDTLSAGEYAAILAKNGNVYVATSGLNLTERGTSGAGEFLDITRFVDWQRAEIQFRVFSALANNPKIPYTDLGIDAITAIIKGALKQGEKNGGITPGTSTVSAPKRADIDSATASTRKLSDVKFGGQLAGAIHQLDISGALTT